MTTYASGENTKAEMINAAGMLAAELGFSNVSTRAVADCSGENIGSIHYHFGGKDGLFEAVVREAMCGHCEIMDNLDDSATPEELSAVIRAIVSAEITDLFRSGRPSWHSQVIYQLLQRDDALFELLRTELLDPNMDFMGRVLKIIQPAMTTDEIHLHTCLAKMPIFAHASYMKAMLTILGVDCYSDGYLQKMEDLLVRQTQLLLGLPDDRMRKGRKS